MEEKVKTYNPIVKRRIKSLYDGEKGEDLMTFFRTKMKEQRLAEFKKITMAELAFVICLNQHSDKMGLSRWLRAVKENGG